MTPSTFHEASCSNWLSHDFLQWSFHSSHLFWNCKSHLAFVVLTQNQYWNSAFFLKSVLALTRFLGHYCCSLGSWLAFCHDHWLEWYQFLTGQVLELSLQVVQGVSHSWTGVHLRWCRSGRFPEWTSLAIQNQRPCMMRCGQSARYDRGLATWSRWLAGKARSFNSSHLSHLSWSASTALDSSSTFLCWQMMEILCKKG